MTKTILYTILLFEIIITSSTKNLLAQFAPPAGQSGSTAIFADSSVFTDWANQCTIERGYVDISIPNMGVVTYGTHENATGKANNSVVSLGDGGIATLTFSTPISNGNGPDFAVFENSFLDDFLELAFVEVSSNGTDYYRFNTISLTQQTEQIGTFGVIDATKINNLAGKYKAFYGTPFDLIEFQNIPGLDISNIISIRIIDVIGSITNDIASYDSEGNIINDPYPTPFETGGFDLDAVGVINNKNNTSVFENNKNTHGIIFPNPVVNNFKININNKINKVQIFDIAGKTMAISVNIANKQVDINTLPTGVYIVKIFTDKEILTTKIIKSS